MGRFFLWQFDPGALSSVAYTVFSLGTVSILDWINPIFVMCSTSHHGLSDWDIEEILAMWDSDQLMG